MPELPTRRRILRKFRIDEISSVDRPAQAGARAVIVKRLDAADDGDEVRAGLAAEGRRLRAQRDSALNADEIHGWLVEEGRKLRSGTATSADGSLDDELERIAREAAQPGESHAQAFERLARTGSDERFSGLLRLRMA